MLLGISFTPKEVGNHFINVYQSGAHILGSPFKIVVGQNEIGDASKVRVYGDGLRSGFSSEVNAFTVDTREAGKIFVDFRSIVLLSRYYYKCLLRHFIKKCVSK